MWTSLFTRRSMKARAESALASILLTRYTILFFFVSVLYCSASGLVQSLLFRVDLEYSLLTEGIVRGGQIPAGNITWRVGDQYEDSNPMILRMCNNIPHGQPISPCTVIFNATVDSPRGSHFQNQSGLQTTRTLPNWDVGMTITSVFSDEGGTAPSGVVLSLVGGDVVLSERCIQTLVYPAQYFANLRREDITWIVLQFWLLAISILAVVQGSVPHVLAVLMTRTISSAWAIYAAWRAPTIGAYLREMISDPGTPCSLELYDQFFTRRGALGTADLVLSTSGLVFFAYVSWTLLRTYNAQSFKVVGAPEHVMRINKYFMAILACLQMEVFALAAGMGLWINVLLETSFLHISSHTNLYEALYFITIILLLPWIATGWHAIRHERKRLMVGFLALGFIIIAGWAILFYSIVFRWVFVQWPYLGCWTVASFILLFATMILGVVCRMNFGKGLKEYLRAESVLASLNFAPDAFDVRANDSASARFSRPSSMHKDKEGGLDFKDQDLTELDISGPPMFFIASSVPTSDRNENTQNSAPSSFPKLVAVQRTESTSSTSSGSSAYSVRRVAVPQIIITGASTTSNWPISNASSMRTPPRTLYDPRTGSDDASNAILRRKDLDARSPFADSSEDEYDDASVRGIVDSYGDYSSGGNTSGTGAEPASTTTTSSTRTAATKTTTTTTNTTTTGAGAGNTTGGSGYASDVSSSESYYSKTTSSPSSESDSNAPLSPPLRWVAPPPLTTAIVRPPRPSDTEENFEWLNDGAHGRGPSF